MLRKIIIAATLAVICGSGASAQFFSLDAGTDGVNLHVSNFFPYAAPVAVAPPVPVVVPYRPGVVVAAPSPKRVRKAVRRATREYIREVGASVLPRVVIAPGAVMAGYGYGFYYDDDDDDYEDYMEDVYKARKKAYKKYRKEMKKYYKHHHKHHHHHHDDDDD